MTNDSIVVMITLEVVPKNVRPILSIMEDSSD
jgi:hypothetical protein